ncbi:glycosyltransferase [Fulvivirga sediminis]|uniref:Glycosyltransferase n=1 Tax=Fulvivirga sediminis TaxID=2803949 RepID=A0A937F9H4_9BACT|nr:glycosyltransferase [Fulvivirga sediminis]MBL3657472.1 glycosyltransferase [Fulvivirga sediminis]
MWYDDKRPIVVKSPSRWQRAWLRSMILTGLGAMGFFLFGVLQPGVIGYEPLYYVLIISLVFLSLRVLFEWYHYFSISIPEKRKVAKEYKVDILTTFCPGEPYEMIIETLEAIQRITYPHTTYLCDEANDPYLIKQCNRLGVKHVTRNNRVDAKAGNINNALKYATGDICVVLDPDHVPAPDFLDEVLPYFDDEGIGFVQVVQAYKNYKENLIAKASAQQTYQFYGPMMMTMNSYGTVQAIGANCTFRRKALDSIGGHAAGLAEDLNTAMKLHAAGWRSTYVPKVLTRGLVPSSISAYYKQQLKWSRGVFELWLTTYLTCFRKFTFRQKLYYGVMPLHYLSGLIYLINFLIPILSLCLGAMPMKMDIIHFLLWSIPFFSCTFLIRHYVQRWVMEEEERGFHILGGLVLIGTWWIHTLGFVFTLLRKKVPYDPTPKKAGKENVLGLLMPNLLLAAISFLAIVYGLYNDFNPYTIAMSGFAGINIGFVVFMFWVGYHNSWRAFKRRNNFADQLSYHVWSVKRLLWLLRHKVYGLFRIAAFPLIILFIYGVYYYEKEADITNIDLVKNDRLLTGEQFLGVFLPDDESGTSSFASVLQLEQSTNMQFGIISTYLAWKPLAQQPFPVEYLGNIYEKGAYPMITWEPWLDLFPLDTNKSIMQSIYQGDLDEYLIGMAEEFRKLQKPFFLRFAHEPDNPQYPWYSSDDEAGEEYIKAWRYMHQLMQAQDVRNIIWVYNPWKAEHANAYFPGHEYVDWLGVTALNYASEVSVDNWNTFEDIYQPFSRTMPFQSQLPVMLSEFGTLNGRGSSEEWFKKAREILKLKYPEVKAVVFFASAYDKNVLNTKDGALNWASQNEGFQYFKDFQTYNDAKKVFMTKTENSALETVSKKSLYNQIRGVDYFKGQDWQVSMHPLFKRNINEDFERIKSLKLSWVKRYGPGIYDHTISECADEFDLKIMYGFWLSRGINFLEDTSYLKKEKKSIIAEIKSRKKDDQIKAWHVGNATWDQLASEYYKPVEYYQKQAYLKWLAALVRDIKKVDDRPVSIELNETVQLSEALKAIVSEVPQLDAIGINLNSSHIDSLRSFSLPIPVFINSVPENFSDFNQQDFGMFANAWQDDLYSDHMAYNGLLDADGRKKRSYYAVKGKEDDFLLPEINILRPAEIAYEGRVFTFNALLKREGQWSLAAFDNEDFEYTWYLIKVDGFGTPVAFRLEGSGVAVSLTIPHDPVTYKLRLKVSKNGQSVAITRPLNTPFYEGSNLEDVSPKQVEYFLK